MTSETIILREPWPWGFDRGAEAGWLYVLRSTQTGLCKIGKSKDVTSRLRQLRSHLPFEIELVCASPVCDRHRVERQYHKHFRHKRVYGEWFLLTQEDIDLMDWYKFSAWPEGLS